MASQYQVINHWIEHEEYPFEVESVLTYCSYCSAKGSNPVATLKDGTTFSGGDKMTTTDALQTQKRYCQSKQENYTYKEHIQCTSTDLLGFTRPIFRLCLRIFYANSNLTIVNSLFSIVRLNSGIFRIFNL